MKNKVFGAFVTIRVNDLHPLVKLSNFICWTTLFELVLPDLKASTKCGKWWLGRKLKVRIHLAIYILQQMFNKTDRQIEYDVKDNAAYQLFCGWGIVENWHCPDHTKIEKFRSRITPETQRLIANYTAVAASNAGFANCSNIDIDSTVQEANMTYPTQAKMLAKLATLSKKIADHVGNHVTDFFHKTKVHAFSVDLKQIKSIYRDFVFNSKKYSDTDKKYKLQNLMQAVTPAVCAAKVASKNLLRWVADLPWNIKRTINQLLNVGVPYLDNLARNIYLGANIKLSLSLHLAYVGCFNKGKLHKNYEFGRAYQLMRLEGNFAMILASTDVRMHDKHSINNMVKMHQDYFGENALKSATADKGYYSSDNENVLLMAGVQEVGIARPGNIKKEQLHSAETIEKLQNRRSAIEPMIGHIKHKGQMGRSRMKSDRTTLSAGYASVLGFNLRQIVRYQAGKSEKVA
jgi:hypothetical protein